MLPALLLGAGLLSKGYGMYQAYQGEQDARNQLNRLNATPVPRYAINPAIARIYGGAAQGVANPQGFSGAEINAFKQNFNQGLNTQYRNALSVGGGSMSRAINSILGGNRLSAYNNFAGQNNQIMRANQNAAYGRLLGTANTMQNIDNQNTQTALQRRLMQEQLLGNAISSNRAYQTNTLNGLGTDLMSAGAMGLGGGGEATGKVSSTGGIKNPFVFNPRLNLTNRFANYQTPQTNNTPFSFPNERGVYNPLTGQYE